MNQTNSDLTLNDITLSNGGYTDAFDRDSDGNTDDSIDYDQCTESPPSMFTTNIGAHQRRFYSVYLPVILRP